MLSAIEQVGPVTGPSAAAGLPYAYHHNTYAIVAAAAAAHPIAPSQDLEDFRCHKFFSQSQQQQHQQHHHQHQHQHQHQHHLGFLSAPPTIANLTLLSPPLSSPSSSISNKSLQHVELGSLLPYKHQQTDSALIGSRHHLQEVNQLMMSANEFTRPRQSASTISVHPIPLQQNNLGIGLKNGYCSPTAFAAQNCTNYSNDQSVPINLVTTSNSFPNSPFQLRRSPSSSSSVDVENDDSMSPVTIQSQTRKLVDQITAPKQAFDQPMSDQCNQVGIVSVAASYPVDYSNLYASRASAAAAALYGAPMFPTHHPPTMSAAASHVAAMRSHATYLSAMPAQSPTAQLNNSNSFSVAYMKAIQNAAVVAGIFSPTAQTLPQPIPTSGNGPHGPSTSSVCSKSNLRQPAGSMLALAPPSGPTMVSHTFHSSSAPNDLRYKSQDEMKSSQNNVLAPLIVASAKLSSGTYLNDKVNTSPADTAAENYFKVPSGKEGSLKHRILTRPASAEKSLELNKTYVMRTHNSTSNFKKGSYIELSNGVFRKVEDMRTEDFIKCAERSLQHQLIESTVVKINITPSTVLITFSYNKNRSRADIEVTAEHPFFVYGQGWASCHPDMSLKAYGLKCQRLQVGDICISLSKREASNTTNSVYSTDAERILKNSTYQTSPSSHTTNRENILTKAMPTQLRDLRPDGVIPTTLAVDHLSVPLTSLTAAPQYHNLPNVPLQLLAPNHLAPHNSVYVEVADMMAIGGPMPMQHMSNIGGGSQQPLHLTRPSFINAAQHYFETPPPQLSKHDGLQCRNGGSGGSVGSVGTKSDTGDEQDEPVDASLSSVSRKRRWSAPESICDSESAEECQPLSLSAGASSNCTSNNFISVAKRSIASNENQTT